MRIFIVTITCLLLLGGLSVAQAQLNGVPYEEKEHGQSGPWRVTTFHKGGRLSHGMIERSYDNGSLLRFFIGENIYAFQVFDNKMLMAQAQRKSKQQGWAYYFTGKVMAAEPVSVTMKGGDTLTNGQDAMMQFNIPKEELFTMDFQNGKELVVDSGALGYVYSLSGTSSAVSAMFSAMGKFDATYLQSAAPAKTANKKSAMAPASQDIPDDVVFDEKLFRQVGNFRVLEMKMNGRFSHVALENQGSYISVSPNFKCIIVFWEGGQKASVAANNKPFPVTVSFIGNSVSKVNTMARIGGGELVNLQDAMIRVDLPATVNLMQHLRSSTELTLDLANESKVIPFGPSGPALAKAIEDCLRANGSNTAKTPAAFPTAQAPVTTKDGLPSGAMATAFPGTTATPNEERIQINPSAPSIRWEVTVPGSGSKHYVVAGKQGQQLSLAFTESTGKGIIDVGRASVEEGVANAVHISLSDTRDYDIILQNSSNAPMTFTVYLELK